MILLYNLVEIAIYTVNGSLEMNSKCILCVRRKTCPEWIKKQQAKLKRCVAQIRRLRKPDYFV